MMYRVYYVVRTIDQVQIALDKLQEAGIGTNRAHVMANNNAELTSRGISHTNYHLKPYLKDLKRGCYLIMVDVDFKEEHDRVHHVLDHALKADRQDDDTRYNPML